MERINKVVFITGSSSGIGRACALRFAQDGYYVIVTYHENQQAGEETAQKCLQQGAKEVSLIHLEIMNEEIMDEAIRNIINKFGRIDILINNSGVLATSPLVETSDEEIERVLAVNLVGLIKLTKYCLPFIKESIVNIGSTLGLQGKKKLTVYSASKWGVRGFTQALADERRDLKIYAVNPGLTATRMGNFEGMNAEKVADIIYNAATGHYAAKSGSDINVRDYIYGEKWARPIRLLRTVKKVMKRFI